ncbi:MAG: hypothetical protein HUU16_15415 [Candidatus Omnitrophica bacterium]|nr:hypothetical protein [Candidatus Omnitrophota bacterium]
MAAPSPTPVPPDPDSCVHDNHECNPLCDPYSFEGGEIWRGIDTDGYRNLVVEIDLSVSGLSAVPHGRRPPAMGYTLRGNLGTGTIGPKDTRQVGYLPWSNCTDIFDVEQCVDCWLIEELISVYYTTEYESPYNGHNPVFDDGGDPLGPGGLNLWKVARAIPRSVLIDDTYGYESERTLTLDFQMQDDTDWRNDGDVSQDPDFGLWIRCLLDSDTDEVWISRITVKGIPIE